MKICQKWFQNENLSKKLRIIKYLYNGLKLFFWIDGNLNLKSEQLNYIFTYFRSQCNYNRNQLISFLSLYESRQNWEYILNKKINLIEVNQFYRCPVGKCNHISHNFNGIESHLVECHLNPKLKILNIFWLTLKANLLNDPKLVAPSIYLCINIHIFQFCLKIHEFCTFNNDLMRKHLSNEHQYKGVIKLHMATLNLNCNARKIHGEILTDTNSPKMISLMETQNPKQNGIKMTISQQ